MRTKIKHYLIGGIFFLFAIVQWNDPDAWLWIPLYGQVFISSLLLILGKKMTWWPLLGVLSGLVGLVIIFPDFVRWIGDGMPSIAGTMKAEDQHIELIREFFGYALILVGSIYYFTLFRKS